MSYIKTDKKVDRVSAFMQLGTQLNRREYKEKDRQYFSDLIKSETSDEKQTPFLQQKKTNKRLSYRESLKAIMSSFARCFPKETLEWRSLKSSKAKLTVSAPEAIGASEEEFRVRIENTILNGCELSLCGTLKKLDAELLIRNKEQFDLIKNLQQSFMGYLRQALPHTQIDFSVRMISTQ